MPKPRYTDKYDNPLYDSFDDRYGDYEDPHGDLFGLHVVAFDDPEDETDE